MSKSRKSLNEIMGEFDDDSTKPTLREQASSELAASSISVDVDSALSSNSLVDRLANPKKKTTKIRFTLDLEKPLDDRLNKAAKLLNRPKAEVARIALERLLEEINT
jgi:hypothetical protein